MKIHDGQLVEIGLLYQTFANYYKEGLEGVKTSIDNFCAVSTISGTTADSIKSYFLETHKPLIDMLETYIQDALDIQQKFFKILLIDVDEDDVSAVDTEVLTKCATDFDTIKEALYSSEIKLLSTMNGIDDVVDLNSVFDDHFGSFKYTAVIDKFNEIIEDTKAVKDFMESVEEAELAGRILEVGAYRETLNTLINEMKGKEVTEPAGYWIDRLEDFEGFELADEAYGESKEYLASVEGQDYGELVEGVYTRYTDLQAELQHNAAINFAVNTYNVVDGVITIGKGIGCCAVGAWPLGVLTIAAGAEETLVSGYDLIFGTCSYYDAQKDGRVDYEYQSIEDKIIDSWFGGSEQAYGAADTFLLSAPVTFLETYRKIEGPQDKKLIGAAVLTTVDVVNNSFLVPLFNWATTPSDGSMSEGTGTIKEEGIGKFFGNLSEDLQDCIEDIWF